MKRPQSTIFHAHVRRDLVENGASLECLIDDINSKIRKHGGIILANRQFLHRPIQLDWRIETYFSDDLTALFDHPVHPWGDAHRRYFKGLWGIENPYQYAEDRSQYDRYCIAGLDPSPYLECGETIHALVHANNEIKWTECECHHTQPVYTSRHRVLCMGCGQLYRVLAQPLARTFETAIPNERWEDALDEHGELTDDQLEIEFVDYQTIDKADCLWTTDAWDQATWLIDFYREGTEEEIKRYEAGLPTIDDFLTAGWKEVPTPPSVASQLADSGVEVDLLKNAEVAAKHAAREYWHSQTKPEALRDAVLNTFQAIELALKLRLEQFGPTATKKNNPAILRKLNEHGVAISAAELAAIDKLRRLRNELQHACSTFAYRDTRRLLRFALAFLDRFTLDELGLWLNHVCDPEEWRALLQIPAIAANAERKSAELILEARDDPTVVAITACGACGRERMVAFDFSFRNCVYCREESHTAADTPEGESLT